MRTMDVRTVVVRGGAVGAVGAGWVLAGYPASLLLARPRAAGQVTTVAAEATPTVSVVVCAASAPQPLAAKLDALRYDGYPPDQLELVVALDGDAALRTVVMQSWSTAVVTFSAGRRGKARALRDALALATGEIVVLTDADNALAPGSLRAAVRHFADPSVWAVAGRRGETGSAYDRYEDIVRRLESRSGSVAAASGEFLAVRRDHLRPVPADVVNDDLWILLDLLARGGRVVYEPASGGVEGALKPLQELERRARIGAGRVQLVGQVRRLPPDAAWRVLNHKVARLALPFLLLAGLCGLPAARGWLGRGVAAGELAILGAGIAHARGRRPRQRHARALTGACAQLVVGLAATACGLGRGLTGRQAAIWRAVR
ncbi:MAG: putative Glycosyl transferase [Solirubrobacterales bacterium]|nr:putative Glycosyl transferase [Solirubrobacterales bacterium]